MKSWGEEMGETWLGEPSVVQGIDSFVRTRLVGHRRLAAQRVEDVAACSVAGLVDDVKAFAAVNRWFWVTASACLLTELIFASKRGGIFQIDERRVSELAPEERAVPTGLYRLRNAVFHPAHSAAGAGAGTPHVEHVVEHLRGISRHDLALSLERSWAFLADRPIAEFAVQTLNAAVRSHPDTRGLIRG